MCPEYQYRCPKCGGDWDEMRKIDERDDLKECPLCHEGRSIRQLAAPGFVLKGLDWHRNDYTKTGPKRFKDGQ
jgi:putative FmdB family regulatory protein